MVPSLRLGFMDMKPSTVLDEQPGISTRVVYILHAVTLHSLCASRLITSVHWLVYTTSCNKGAITKKHKQKTSTGGGNH